ncbi:MAG: phosphatidylserine decarboxylase family protein [bacterium]
MKKRLIPIAREGFILIKCFAGLTALFYITGYYARSLYLLSGLSFLLMIFMMFFFRDPERVLPQEDNVVVSPADGKVMAVEKTKHEFINAETNVVKIFMSPFNMHVQRSPVDGVVKFVKYTPGKFLPAYKQEADIENENNQIAIESPSLRVVVQQIAGILARRIVCWCKEGDNLKQGQRLGLIKFSSQVDLYVPSNVLLKVNVGDRVKAGVTVIGKIE